MKKLIKFGKDVEGYNIPVLNEREIRTAAGISQEYKIAPEKIKEIRTHQRLMTTSVKAH